MSQFSGDIAIIGMACLYPGAPNAKTFWENILSKVDTVSEPPEGWGADHFFDPESNSDDRIYCKRGGFIAEFADFNPLDFGIMPNAMDGCDPEHFLCLRVVHEALSDSGYLDKPFNRKRTALILGRGNWMNRGYFTLFQRAIAVDQTLQVLKQLYPETSDQELQSLKRDLRANLPPFNADTCQGLIPNLVTGRIANRLDLRGPNYTVDAACASSLVALDSGVRELLDHRCDMAIVGGANVSAPPLLFMIFCQLGALSKRGRIRPFDRNADGTLLGEGIGVSVIKRREDAEQDGDRIYAVVKNVGIASDGRAVGVLVPRLEGELLALQRAYEGVGIHPETIGMIETHGTGTKIGDATEIQAMTRIFNHRGDRGPRCAIGSVKSMIGHTIPAAGMAGLIKSVLCLYHKTLAPTLCDEPNPDLELDKTPFYVNTEPRPWIHGGSQPRRAGVNAFGFGGINAHAVLEEHPGGKGAGERPSPLDFWDTEVVILSGESREDLIREAERLIQFVAEKPEVELKDIAYTLNCQRKPAAHRLSIVAGSLGELEKRIGYALKRLRDPLCKQIKDRSGVFFFEEPLGPEGKLAFLFPGEGSQYVNMLFDLCLHFEEVRACFDRIDRIFANNGRTPLPSQVIYPPPHTSIEEQAVLKRMLFTMEYAVQLVGAANYGLKQLLDKVEIRPDALLGHSFGEITACLASGMTGDHDENWLFQIGHEINRQHQTVEKTLPLAKLLAVGGSDPAAIDAIVAESNGELCVSMDNCPNQIVLCGPETAVESAFERLRKEGAICNFLPFDRAYHTPLCQALCDNSIQSVERIARKLPQIDIYSCVTADLYPKKISEIRRIITEQWSRPVRFRETIEAMHRNGVKIFVEAGPRGNLTSFVEDILGRRRYVAVAGNAPNQSSITQFNRMIGLLSAHHVPMRLDPLYVGRHPQPVRMHLKADNRIKAPLGGSEKKSDKTGAVRLNTTLPWLRVTQKPLAEKRLAAFSNLAVTAPGATQGPSERSVTVLEKGRHKSLCPKNSDTASPEKGRGYSVGCVEQPNENDRPLAPRSRVLLGYLANMERFLEQQKNVMEAYMEKKKTFGKRSRGFPKTETGADQNG